PIAGCGLQKRSQRVEVLRTEDFISDSTTAPTQTAGPPAQPDSASHAAPTVVPTSLPTGAIFNVSASIAAPADSRAPINAVAAPVLVDAKAGELNGRPIRADDLLEELGPMLSALARERRFTLDQWAAVLGRVPNPSKASETITREDWLDFAHKLIAFKLND